MNMIASSQGTRLLESFSKLVEGREAVKLYLAHKLATCRFFAVKSRILVCACTQTWVPGTHGCRCHSGFVPVQKCSGGTYLLADTFPWNVSASINVPPARA